MNKLLIGAALVAVTGVATAQGPNSTQWPSQLPKAQHTQPMRTWNAGETRDQVVAKVRQHFARLDTNRDGFIAKDEMQARRAMQMKMKGDHQGNDGHRMAMRHGPMADPAAAFDRLDANKDGAISRDEFAKARQMRMERRAEMHRGDTPRAKGGKGMRGMHRMGGMRHGRMMKMADLDNDGRVSLQEAQDSALKHFDMLDSNRDGRLTPEERREMRMKLRSERAPKAG